MSLPSSTPSLTPSRSPSPAVPAIPFQPDHFYGTDDTQLHDPSLLLGKQWLDPADDPMAQRGIPVFRPTMDDFEDFESFVSKVECWGQRSGIIKIIPPQEWKDALPPLTSQLSAVKIKSPIEQNMLGRGGLFRQENVEKRRMMSVREWSDLCGKEEYRAPSALDFATRRGAAAAPSKPKRARKGTTVDQSKSEDGDDAMESTVPGPSSDSPSSTPARDASEAPSEIKSDAPKPTKTSREAARAALDKEFLESFNPHAQWLPQHTTASDYTPDFCSKLERFYWRTCGFGKPAWYGADCEGSLFTDDVKSWNVAHLESALSRLLPESSKHLPGVNTPYLYFGMWRATFAWHVEDMDLFSINYIHFGAPKFWYAVPQGRASALEQTMRGYFPRDTSQCHQFLRHKSFLASPTLLAQSSCRPNTLVQHAQEIVITFPRGYHAGFNLGLNCAESVNFALTSWIDLGLKAKACECITDSVRIDVRQLLDDYEARQAPRSSSLSSDSEIRPPSPDPTPIDALDAPRKRKAPPSTGRTKASKKPKLQTPDHQASGLTFKIPARVPEEDHFPCCLCVSTSEEDLLPVHEPPLNRKDACDAAGNPKRWMAHRLCAEIVPETWVDTIDLPFMDQTGVPATQRVSLVFGVDGVVKDRWNLKCSACLKTRSKAHGAPVQCTKGKCMKAFHVSCARGGGEQGITFRILRQVEKEVIMLKDSTTQPPLSQDHASDQAADPHVLKIIQKTEAELLCPQHNPAIAAAKKASKQDKMRETLLSLPPGSRIKIRVSSGLFEVTLLRVIEETGSVEVLWDRGIKREFRWSSVHLGKTDCPVQQWPIDSTIPNALPIVASGSIPFGGNAPRPSAQHPEHLGSCSAQGNAILSDGYQPPNIHSYPHSATSESSSRHQHEASSGFGGDPARPTLDASNITPRHENQDQHHHQEPLHKQQLLSPSSTSLPQPKHASPHAPGNTAVDGNAQPSLVGLSKLPVDWNMIASLSPEEVPGFLQEHPQIRELVLRAAAEGALPT